MLSRRRRDLRGGERRFPQRRGQRVDRVAGLTARLSGLAHTARDHFGRQHRGVGRLLDLAEELPHLYRRLLRLAGELLHFAGHDREPLAVLAGS